MVAASILPRAIATRPDPGAATPEPSLTIDVGGYDDGDRNLPSDRSSDNPITILSRDNEGVEQELRIAVHRLGLISISDDEIVRIMAPNSAVAMVLELLHALGGPISAHS